MVVDSITDPFATQIRYKCFKDHMRPVHEEHYDAHIQHMHGAGVKQKFLEDVRKKVFEDGEARTLKSLTADYEKMRLNFGVQTTVRTSHVKDILIAEFGEDIGFQTRYHKNQSTIVYSSKDAGNYIESAINFWGIDTNELLKAAAKRIKDEVSSTSQMVWPPEVSELTGVSKKVDETPDFLQNFLHYLNGKDTEKTPVQDIVSCRCYKLAGKGPCQNRICGH